MKAQQNHFQSAKKDFQTLKKNKQIPPQMQTKLQYLLSRIQKQTLQSSLVDLLPEYQKASLDQLNTQTGIHLFCSIVNCLSGKQVVLYFKDEKAYIRKDQIFSMWKQCWITCDSNNILVRKKLGEKPYYIFQMTNLKISKNFRVYKKKYVFGANYKKQKSYFIGFDFQSSCSRIHELLRSLIRQKNNKLNKKKTNDSMQQVLTERSGDKLVMREQSRRSQDSRNNTEQNQQFQDPIQLEEELGEEQVDQNSDKGFVIQFIKQEEIAGDSLYKLHKTQQNIRQMINKNYPNKLKTEIIMQKPKQLTNIFDYYIKLSEWNPEIQQSTIKIKLSENSYLIQIRVKKYSYISWPRETILLVTSLIYNNKYYLVLRSTEEDCSYTDTVKMEWNQILEISQSQDKILVSFNSQYDFKGYSSLEDSQRMSLKVLDNLKLFTRFCQAKEISGKNLKVFNIVIGANQNKNVTKKKISKDQNNKQSTKEKGKDNNKDDNNNKNMLKKPFSQNINLSQSKNLSPTLTAKQKIPRKKSNGSQFEIADNQSKQQTQNQKQPNKPGNLQFQTNNLVNDPANFTIYKPKSQISQISEKLIQHIRQKSYEKYYLKNKFDLEPHFQPNRLECFVQEPNHYILQNNSWKINEEEDLVFINQKTIQLQKDIIKMIIKQLGSNLLSGKSIMNMSLPVEIFDNKSILERFAVGFGYAPKFLIPASQTQDLMEQVKLLTLFVMGLGPLNLTLQKPFNPILGQTFQCRVGGIPLYFQQISHHPPISAVLMKTDNFVFHGAFNSHAQMGLNRVAGRNLTPLYVEFPKTNTSYQIKVPDMQISGIVHGQKKYRGQGKAFIHQRTNNIFVQWCIGKDKKKVYQSQGKVKPNDLYGGIYTVTQNFGKKFKQCENKQKFDGLKPQDIIQKHCKITGHWCLNVNFDGKTMKTILDPLPNRIQYQQYSLPSDSNFRLDLLYKRMENLKVSNQQKQVLENIQRRDRKLREGKIKPGQN